MQDVFRQLKVPLSNSDDDNFTAQPGPPKPQVTPHSRSMTWKFHDTPVSVTITIEPGIYIQDPDTGKWNRSYGGEHERLGIMLHDPFDTDTRPYYERDYYVRCYATYNRQKIDAKWKWVRIDEHPDLLSIDNTDLVQGIPAFIYPEK